MKKNLFLFLSLLPCFLLIQQANAQDFTNKGRDFWVAYGNHVRMFEAITANNAAEKMQLYMTSDVNTTGTIDIPGIGFKQAFTVTANQVTTVDVPRTAALLDEGSYNLGIHVTAVKPVVVYSFIYVNSISGATLCLPVSTLGKDYYSVNYTQISNSNLSYSYFDVIATDTGTTTVEITPAQNTKGGHLANVPFTVTLTQGQVYQGLGALTSTSVPYRGVDLTGSHIRSLGTGGSSCKKIAVFCGSGKISIGCGTSSGTSDNLYQQMYPLSTWGKTYITVPSVNKSSTASQTNYFRIFKSDPAAVVKLDGTAIANTAFVNNQYYEFSSSTASLIESDKPMLVAQYLTTGGCSGNSGQGDPEMIYLNPLEQTISTVTLNSMQPAANTNINEHHINVVCKNTPEITGSFRIDGVVPGGFVPLGANSLYAYAQLTVGSGAHTLTCDSGFNAIAYGFGSAESYGYSAGTNLKDLYQFVSVQNEYAVVGFPAGCRNSPFRFSIVLPYQPPTLKWGFNGLFPDTTLQNPVYDSTWVVNDKTLYRFRINRFYSIPATGTYPITILANNPTGDGCSGEQELSYDLQIFERPKAAFGSTGPACLGDTMRLTDSTTGNGRQVVRWNWSFGDQTAASTKNPFHVYSAPGTYTVKFSAITDIGCVSDTVTKQVVLTQSALAAFSLANAPCENTLVRFNDLSTPANGDITKWTWNFGDGTTAAVQQPVHTFKAGNASVTLQVETKTGCKSSTSQTFQVGYRPQARFSLPQICLNDAFAAFTDSSTIAGNTQGPFQYRWQFGDQNASAANPDTSLVRNATHHYSAAGNYTVNLRVTSAAGCSADSTQTFVVNGAVPKADFDVVQPALLCSSDSIRITDRSSVDFGKITRNNILWDNGGNPALQSTDAAPVPGRTYSTKYPVFGTPASRTVQVTYTVYSGISCSQQVTKTITLLATPQLKWDSVPPVCADTAAFQVTGAREVNGLQGTGLFSGTGITAAGLFSPSAIRSGTAALYYTFTTSAGCKAVDTGFITVYPVPLANAGPDKTVLEGGSVQLDGQAAAGSTVRWTPATYLDNPAILKPKVSPQGNLTYKLVVTSAQGCKASDEVTVTLLKDLQVPNAFSPNGDGVNDTWKIPYLASYPGATIEIFNRYGQKVFSSTDYTREWNGTYNGSPLPLGTYYWILDPKNGRKQINGSVTIIR